MTGIHHVEIVIGAVLSLGSLVTFGVLPVCFLITPALWLLAVVTVPALLLGLHLVASIGGGDMPVVVSMLNSYSAGQRRRRASWCPTTC